MSLEVFKKVAVIISDLEPDSIDSPKCILQEIAGLLQSQDFMMLEWRIVELRLEQVVQTRMA
ncbi:MAG: hypothetical protein AABO57_13405 [Acidobacteriota bacterium]